ncbi:MAG: N-6 DNA methylase [Clostridioides sp.]|nr:N-6 DNA methylase [Clostridioides sp.]
MIKSGDFTESKNYEKSLSTSLKKNTGTYYTPRYIIDYIMEKTLSGHDIVDNPYPKVLDPACGCGNFLLVAYEVLYKLISQNLDVLAEKYGSDYWNKKNIHNHIVKNCIYGFDIDRSATNIFKDCLMDEIEGIMCGDGDRDVESSKLDVRELIQKSSNIKVVDSLKYEPKMKFDYIIGNPPYIGHKNIDFSYKKFLSESYRDVYVDKSDLYYCFFKRIDELLTTQGVSSIIIPRYFLESPSAKNLRKYISRNLSTFECVDFLGAKVFKNIGISSCIYTFGKSNSPKGENWIHDYTLKYYDMHNYKMNSEDLDEKEAKVFRIVDEEIDISDDFDISEEIKFGTFEHMNLKMNDDGSWLIAGAPEESILSKINKKCEFTLDDIVESFQGIITGCDRAFVYKSGDEILDRVGDKYTKRWIKSKNIKKYLIGESRHFLVYSDLIAEEETKNYFKSQIYKYKDKLMNRRECRNNSRQWYELQWGRTPGQFERIKIMYPYKSKENRFAIDYCSCFSSADVYSFYIKEEYNDVFSYEYLVGLLNSNVYDRYYKINAKKMSKGIYDYYPNKVLQMKIFKDENYHKIENLSKRVIEKIFSLDHCEDNCKDEMELYFLQTQLEKLIEKSLSI